MKIVKEIIINSLHVKQYHPKSMQHNWLQLTSYCNLAALCWTFITCTLHIKRLIVEFHRNGVCFQKVNLRWEKRINFSKISPHSFTASPYPPWVFTAPYLQWYCPAGIRAAGGIYWTNIPHMFIFGYCWSQNRYQIVGIWLGYHKYSK